MRRAFDSVTERVQGNIFTRPLLFIALGILVALLLLRADALAGPDVVPLWLRFDASVARTLFTTLAGAALTIAGITFWVRAAAVQMAANQFTPRVVQGFLHDWFQQSMMGLLLGIFAYLVVVLRAVPEAGATAPHLSVLTGVVLAAGSVLAVLWAIRNGVESMQAGELARRITDETIKRIRKYHPAGAPGETPEHRDVPATSGYVVRATSSGWLQAIDETRLLQGLSDDAIVRLEVRVGLFVRQGRALCTIWSQEGVWLDIDPRVRRAITLGRSRVTRHDIHYGLQQLADIARGSLSHGTADPGAASEVIVHLEMILRELLGRRLPPVVYRDERGRQMIRRRDYSIDDYVVVAFGELRLAAAQHPSVVIALLDTIGSLVGDLETGGRPGRARPLRLQARLALEACEQAGLPAGDLAQVREVAVRHGLVRPVPQS